MNEVAGPRAPTVAPNELLNSRIHDRGNALPCACAIVDPSVAPCRCSGDSEPALVLKGVTAGYGRGEPVLRDVELTVPRGACYAVLGPSGGGKTTLLRVALGLLPPRCGTVTRPCERELNRVRRGAVGYIPQNLGLVRNRTVRENVLLGALSRLPFWRSVTGVFPRVERERAEEALAAVGLVDYADCRVETLSGGQRRRVAIARALVQRPVLLLADEFLAELDDVTAAEMVDLLNRVRRTAGMTLVFVDHHIELACRIAERIVVVTGGAKVCELTAEEATPARIRSLYREAVAA